MPVTFTYADESDRGPYPVPAGAKVEGGSGAVFDLRSNALRRAGGRRPTPLVCPSWPVWSATTEVAAGRVDHAIRITVPQTRTGYTWPATHSASSATDRALPQLGQRFRLKPSVRTAGLPRQARVSGLIIRPGSGAVAGS